VPPFLEPGFGWLAAFGIELRVAEQDCIERAENFTSMVLRPTSRILMFE
jgi:hypothetical protein